MRSKHCNVGRSGCLELHAGEIVEDLQYARRKPEPSWSGVALSPQTGPGLTQGRFEFVCVLKQGAQRVL